MINLIPTEEKKKLRNNFFSNLLVVFFAVISFLFFITTVAILPAFIISYGQKQVVNKKLEIQQAQEMPEIDQKAQIDTEDLNNKLNLIEKAINDKYVVSQTIINEILANKMLGIKIIRIFYENDEIKGKKVVINGIANSREQLLQFRRAFENSNVFKNVNLPISNFVKGQNIQFNLELTAL